MSNETVYISVGSNIDPHVHIPEGIKRLLHHPKLNDLKVSSFYISEAIGRVDQPDYCNGVVSFSTDLPPLKLKEELRAIESDSGRVRVPDRYAPRTLDLDIILFGDRIHQGKRLSIPDAAIAKWSFIYVPLLEINPDIFIPGLAEPLAHMIPSEQHPSLNHDPQLTLTVQEGLHHE